MQPNDELLPCPFCGGRGEYRCVRGMRYPWVAYCVGCGATAGGSTFQNDEWNAQQWNRRAALSRGEALAKAEAQIARLRNALLNERVDTLWNAYHCGIERDGKWMDAAMSDAEWLRRECGIEEEGWIDAEDLKHRIPGAAAKWVKSLGGDDA